MSVNENNYVDVHVHVYVHTIIGISLLVHKGMHVLFNFT